jgi:hypothetical protein
MPKRLTPNQIQWNTCGASHPDKEGVVCNRGRGHRGEHQDVGPETQARAATIWYRWPRETSSKRPSPAKARARKAGA